jgi:hypothetical protein
MFEPRKTLKEHYPFIQFVTVIAIPTAYWVAAIELGVRIATPRDNHIMATFGQVNPTSFDLYRVVNVHSGPRDVRNYPPAA